MKVSDLKKMDLGSAKVWAQTLDHADSTTLVRSTEELHNWADAFISKFEDAEVILTDSAKIKIKPNTNKKFDDWYNSYLDSKQAWCDKYGSN